MAALCLVNELDYGSLEVLGMAVRNRLEEFDSNWKWPFMATDIHSLVPSVHWSQFPWELLSWCRTDFVKQIQNVYYLYIT